MLLSQLLLRYAGYAEEVDDGNTFRGKLLAETRKEFWLIIGTLIIICTGYDQSPVLRGSPFAPDLRFSFNRRNVSYTCDVRESHSHLQPTPDDFYRLRVSFCLGPKQTHSQDDYPLDISVESTFVAGMHCFRKQDKSFTC